MVYFKIGFDGTFIGFYFNFIFDNTNISDGVEGFLGGMKICFLTSITGMIGELYLKHKYSSEVIEGSSLDDTKAINLGNNFDGRYGFTSKLNETLRSQFQEIRRFL